MPEYKHLKDRSYYEDRYDRHTVEQSRWYETHFDFNKEEFTEDGKKVPAYILKWMCHLVVYEYTGKRWENRDRTINEWMEEDRKEDDMYENTPVPKNIACFMCRRPLELMDKSLRIALGKDPVYMEFFFRCEDCHIGVRVVNGREERIIPWMCPKCKRRMKSEHKQTKDKITTKDWCDYCGYEKAHELDLSRPRVEKEEVDPEEERKFQEDKLRFCITTKEGYEYLDHRRRMDEWQKIKKEIDERENTKRLKLEANPKGFPLEEPGYSCMMCKTYLVPFDNWYDKYGIKCMTCQHALEKRAVPLKYFKDIDSWYSTSDLKYSFGIQYQTAMKLVRQGKMKVLFIPSENGGEYHHIFPKKENKEFLAQYKNSQPNSHEEKSQSVQG